ncbi:MAG: GDP-L-fucose synthase [Rhodothermia bacterium]|nr:GDP-L-fucose synthase [Rhodothermia bacterium]
MHLQSPDSKVYVAGHTGLVGSAVYRGLKDNGFTNLVGRRSTELDLRVQEQVQDFFESERPDFVVLAAARVGGILANDAYPADFISDNLAIQVNVIRAAHEFGIKRLVFLGSSCIYPKMAPQPLKEEYMLTGPLEPTNQWYAIAKISGVKMCEAYRRQHGDDFVSLMPTNLYGPNDNFDLKTSHVLPALIRKFHEAKVDGHDEVVLWGTGTPRREFLYNKDLADAVLFILKTPESELYDVAPDGLLNVGVGEDMEIRELADMIREVVGVECRITHDLSKPDGTPRKLMDVSRLTELGWTARTGLREGIRKTYEWFVETHATTEDTF